MVAVHQDPGPTSEAQTLRGSSRVSPGEGGGGEGGWEPRDCLLCLGQKQRPPPMGEAAPADPCVRPWRGGPGVATHALRAAWAETLPARQLGRLRRGPVRGGVPVGQTWGGVGQTHAHAAPRDEKPRTRRFNRHRASHVSSCNSILWAAVSAPVRGLWLRRAELCSDSRPCCPSPSPHLRTWPHSARVSGSSALWVHTGPRSPGRRCNQEGRAVGSGHVPTFPRSRAPGEGSALSHSR